MPSNVYADADAYDRYMGAWSSLLAPIFLDFAGFRGITTVVDVGCGTGNLLASAHGRVPGAQLFGIDPSEVMIQKAASVSDAGDATFLLGTAEQNALPSHVADFTLSMLVLQEFPDLQAALQGMRRITKPGGVVAACQWDYERMPVVAALTECTARVSPSSGDAYKTAPMATLDQLSGAWSRAGFSSIKTARLSVTRRFESFDELWNPLLAGSTPSTRALAILPAEQRERVRCGMQRRLSDADGPFEVTADVLCVRGAS